MTRRRSAPATDEFAVRRTSHRTIFKPRHNFGKDLHPARNLDGIPHPPQKGPVMIRRLAQACFRHRLRVVIGWIVALVVLMMVSGAVGTGYSSDFTLPDVESKRGVDILEDRPSATPWCRSWTRSRRSRTSNR